LDKKSELLEEGLTEAIHENERLQKRITDFEREHSRLLERIADMEAHGNANAKLMHENSVLAKKIELLENERKNLLSAITGMETEKKNLTREKKEDKHDLSDGWREEKQKLLDRVDGMEKERLNLFRMIGEMEESKKIVPYLDKKTAILEEELKQAKRLITELTTTIANVEKEHKELLKNNSDLEEKRAARLSLEQENGKLLKKNSELENELAGQRNEVKALRSQRAEQHTQAMQGKQLQQALSKHELGQEALLQKIASLEKETALLAKTAHNEELHLAQANQHIQTLTAEKKELMEKNTALQQNSQVPYTLDKEKLDELREFTLEAIQTRRWKNAEFINGAYDAIGLFYRTLLADRPIRKKLK
jgi:chromosome segregation ATPase